jgi:predicted Zn-dependent peptidase
MVAALTIVFALPAVAGQAGHIEYKEYTLDNGLRVILSEDHSVPIVAVNVWYHVGSGYEEEGRSGFAHFFEHMMFQGSENVAKREHSNYVQRAGGNVNGTTNEDRTLYFEILPANQLAMGLWLEADRMRALKITNENFENQRNAVKEERLMRIDNQPYGAAFITADTLAYDYEPYNHSVIGKMVDLDAAEVGDVQRFFDQYYNPNNAVLCLVGDIDPKQTMAMVEEYFGDIPRGPEITQEWGGEPPHSAERRKVIEDKNANVPAIFINYIVPNNLHEDIPALELLGNVLTGGEASRMHQRLVKEEEAAVVVFGGTDIRKGPSLFRFIAASNVGVDIETCENLIYEELDKLKKEGLAGKELEKAKVQFRTGMIQSRETAMNKAEALQSHMYYEGNLEKVNSEIGDYMAVTTEDIIRVAKKYFTKENRTVVIANPASKESS